MAAPIVQARYDELEAVAARFGRQAESATALEQTVREAFQPLANGGWRGDAAQAFAHEMDGGLLPAMRRLTDALAAAREATLGCGALMREAEAEAARLFADWAIAESAPGAQLIGAGPGERSRPGLRSFDGGALALDLTSLLTGDPPPSYGEFLDAIHTADIDGSQAILGDPALLGRISQIYGQDGTVIMAALLEGALRWPNGSGPDPSSGQIDVDTTATRWPEPANQNHFAAWMLGGVDPPDPRSGQMNCWEMVMYAAYLNGQIDLDQLREIHAAAASAYQTALNDPPYLSAKRRFDEANELVIQERRDTGAVSAASERALQEASAALLPLLPGKSYYDAITSALGAGDEQLWLARTAPPAGSVIFFQSGGSKHAHVAIATGRLTPDGQTEIVSLWKFPRDPGGSEIRTTQLTTVEEIQKAMAEEGMPIDPDGITYGGDFSGSEAAQ